MLELKRKGGCSVHESLWLHDLLHGGRTFCSVTEMVYDRGWSCEPEVVLDGCHPSGEWGMGHGGERERKKEKYLVN